MSDLKLIELLNGELPYDVNEPVKIKEDADLNNLSEDDFVKRNTDKKLIDKLDCFDYTGSMLRRTSNYVEVETDAEYEDNYSFNFENE